MSTKFSIVSEFIPRGDQPLAIATLKDNLTKGKQFQTLLGATGTGKTFTIANIIEEVQKPTLVMAPNKTLAAQLYNELKEAYITFVMSNAGYQNHYLHIDIKSIATKQTNLQAYVYFSSWESQLPLVAQWASDSESGCELSSAVL